MSHSRAKSVKVSKAANQVINICAPN